MSRIIVDITVDLEKIPNLEELLPQEFAVGGKLKEAGLLEHLFVKVDKTGAVLVMDNVDIDKAKEQVAKFPLFKYFDNVEYIVADKQF
jgi:muconolactone delta-isomerase